MGSDDVRRMDSLWRRRRLNGLTLLISSYTMGWGGRAFWTGTLRLVWGGGALLVDTF